MTCGCIKKLKKLSLEEEAMYFQTLAKEIEAVGKDRPVLVFFEDTKRLEEFKKSAEFHMLIEHLQKC